MKRKASSQKLPPRYFGIGEWYGADITRTTAEQRKHLAGEALSNKAKVLPCPNRPDRLCHKRGGVCSLRQYIREVDGTIRMGGLVTTCPSRFFDGGEVFRWIGEVMLGTSEPKVLNEIPFLQKFSREQADPTAEDEEGDFIGRTDNILVHPDTSQRLEWCALEMQAVYFSGMAMSHEFRDINENPESLRFPVQKRRPDFRSSGPQS